MKYELLKEIAKNSKRKIIVVQGLGFVGAVMSLVCANTTKEDYLVFGIDLKSQKKKIDSINSGKFPINASDKKIIKFYANSRKNKNFFATHDERVFSLADFIIVDINLDVKKNSSVNGKLLSYDVNLDNFKKGIVSIGKNCKENVLVLVETTVPPGTCINLIRPTILNELKKRKLSTDKLKIGHSYERVMPGPNYIDSIINFYRVYSGIDEASADETEKFLKTIISTHKYPLTRLMNTNATEMAKVLENSYRSYNIAFAVEWSRYAEEAGVNLYEIVNAIRMRPTHSNMMLPGIGVGGYCLTKDPLLASWAKVNNFKSNKNLEQSELGVFINDQMPLFCFNFLKKSFKLKSFFNLKVLLLGVSYRSDVGDTRYSPVELLYKLLKRDNASITLHDPYVDYWEEIDMNINQNLYEILNFEQDIIVISTGHKEYLKRETISKFSEMKNIKFLDTVGLFNENEIKLIGENNSIKVLGRGDL